MRILHIDTGKEMRGGQHQVLLLLESLREANITQMLLARDGSPLFDAAVRRGFAVHPANPVTIWTESRRAGTVAHSHDARAHSLAALLSGAPFVASRRVAFPVNRSLASQWKYRRAKRYLAVSNHVASRLMLAGIRSSRIDVVYDAVAEIPALSPWQADGPLVALASADPQKGRDLAERAAHVARMPVLFSEDLAEDLPKASAFVYISRSEGLGSAALLAMSLGVPVIASAVGGLPEVVIHQETGLQVSNDEAAIAHAMRSIVEEPELTEKMRRAAHARLAVEFSPARLVQRTLDSYRSALDS